MTQERLKSLPFWVIVLIIGVVSCVPVAFSKFPPLVDFPMHVARVHILALPGGGNEFYRADWGQTSNLGMDLVMPLFLRLFDPVFGAKVFICFAVFTFVAGAALCFRAWGADLKNLVFVPLLTYDQWFMAGFINYFLGIGLALLAYGSLGRSSPSRNWLLLLPLVAVLYVTHLLGAVLFVLLLVNDRLIASKGLPQAARTIIGGTLVMLAGMALFKVVQGDPVYNFSVKVWTFANVSGLVSQAPIAWLVYPALVVLAFLAIRRQVTFRTESWPLLASLALVSFLGPSYFGGTAFTSERLSLALAVLGLGSISVRAVQAEWSIVTAAVKAALVTYAWVPSSTALQSFYEPLKTIPKGSVFLHVSMSEGDPQWWRRYQHHFIDWLVPLRDGFVPQLFTKRGQQPLQYSPAAKPFHDFQGNDPLVRDNWNSVWADLPQIDALSRDLERSLGRKTDVFLMVSYPKPNPGREPMYKADEVMLFRLR